MLSNVLRKAADAIRGTNRPTATPGFLRPIDTDWIAREARLDEVGSQRGRSNIPPFESKGLDSVEQQFIQRIESEWSWQGGELINNLRAYSQRLVGYSIESEFANLQIAAKDTLAQLRAADHRAEAELGPLREDYVALRDALAGFRTKHRLNRIAQTPARRWTTFGLLAILVAIESIFNGFFFSKGSEFGLLGGVGIAIGISLINVIFSFLLGLWPARFINFRNRLIKVFAFVFTAAGLCAILMLHGYAAHYRDAVAAVGETGGLAEAMRTIKATPWQLADMNSYYLFGLGVIFAIGAFYKGCRFDDPYPFYGAKSRATAQARDDYSEAHAELFEDLAKIKNQTVGRLSDGISRIPLFPQQAANIRAQRAALVQTFRGYEASVVSAANQLLARYRDANRQARQTPTPPHFDETWKLPHSFLDSPELRTLVADREEVETDTSVALSELSQLSQDVINEYEKLLTAYPHATKMEPSNGAQSAKA